jgi:anti-anti-sigma factor
MQVQVERGQRFAVVRPVGSFYGGSETVDLEHVLGALIDEQLSIVVIDLSRTRDLNSSAIGVLVGAYRRATARGTALRLSGADRALQNVLTILKLVNVLPVYDHVEAALAAMPSRPGSIAPAVAAFAAAPIRRV